ncbi:iron-sulfur protein [Clostridia bacterium]|nr:iron-sulfur protein [Clostridia bacterium]
MTIFYFTATGNSLAVAKRIAAQAQEEVTLISIPQIMDNLMSEYQDDCIGLIFPIYGCGLPKMVNQFLSHTKLKADYTFTIGTYGFMSGACMFNVQKQGGFDYAESLLMVDNYLPGYEITEEIAKQPQKKTEENLQKILSNISARQKKSNVSTLPWKILTPLIQFIGSTLIKNNQAKGYFVNENCVKCNVCAKVCPSGNITVSDKVHFHQQCEGCLSCVHLCPKNAIHVKHERSTVRWRHPDITLNEIIEANNRI